MQAASPPGAKRRSDNKSRHGKRRKDPKKGRCETNAIDEDSGRSGEKGKESPAQRGRCRGVAEEQRVATQLRKGPPEPRPLRVATGTAGFRQTERKPCEELKA